MKKGSEVTFGCVYVLHRQNFRVPTFTQVGKVESSGCDQTFVIVRCISEGESAPRILRW